MNSNTEHNEGPLQTHASSKALGKRKAAGSPGPIQAAQADGVEDAEPESSKRVKLQSRSTSLQSGDGLQEGSSTAQRVGEQPPQSPISSTRRPTPPPPSSTASTTESEEAGSDDEIVMLSTTSRPQPIDLTEEGQPPRKPKEREKIAFYALTCPICLSSPSPLVVTMCGHPL